jgi:hypothetical protein
MIVRTFLMNVLANGPVPAKAIEARATVCGLSKDQLNRAKRKMGVVTYKEKIKGGSWFWKLPKGHIGMEECVCIRASNIPIKESKI